jgi:putative transcriptional regulator
MIVWKLDDVMRRKRAKGREMARNMGIGENYLSRVRHEVPERLSLTLLDALCHELDCTIADLLEYQPGPMPQPAPEPEKPKRAPAPRKPKAPSVVAAAVAAEPAIPAMPVQAPAPVAAEIASEPTGGLSLAQRRAREALLQDLAPEVPAEPAEVSDEAKGAAVVRTSALQAKLDRLRRRRD